MRNKFEELIELIINEETEKANELFHNVVVEKSREIYNELVAEDEGMGFEDETEESDDSDMSMDSTDDMMGDIAADEEGVDSTEDEFGSEEGESEFGNDSMDDESSEEDFGGEEESGDIESKFDNFEDAFEQLRDEFRQIMGDDVDQMTDEMPEEGVVREYVEKVKDFYKGDNGEGQAVGAGSIGGSTNTRSTVAGKNDMGGSVKNLVQGGTESDPDGKQYSKPSNAYSKGEGKLPGADKFENVPGAKAGKTFSNAKKPVSSEQGGVNKKSVVGD